MKKIIIPFLIVAFISSANNVFAQLQDGSDCGKAIVLPAPAQTCSNNTGDEFNMKKNEMWFEFTGNDSAVTIMTSDAATNTAEITMLTLMECPTDNCNCINLHVRKQSPPPMLDATELIPGKKYKVKVERVPREVPQKFQMCVLRGGIIPPPPPIPCPPNCPQQPTIPCSPPPQWNSYCTLGGPGGTPIPHMFVFPTYTLIGIGTNTPQARLHVMGNTIFDGLIDNRSGGYKFPDGSILTTAKGQWKLAANGNDIYYDNGNVGIGTSSPDAKLEVNGDACFKQGIVCSSTQPLIVKNKDNPFLYMVMNVDRDWDNDGRFDGNVGIGCFREGQGWKDLVLNGGGGTVKVGTASYKTNLKVSGTTCLKDGIECESYEPLIIKNVDNPDLYFAVDVDRDWNNDGTPDGNVGIGGFKRGEGWKDLILNAGGGNVGIGTTEPQAKLDVDGNINIRGGINAPLKIGTTTNAQGNLHVFSSAGTVIYSESNHTFDYGYNIISKVNRGTTKAFAVLKGTTENFVVYGDGKVLARSMWLTSRNPFPDYVFDKSYKLLTLYELEQYIDKNKHLPNMPSAQEFSKNDKFDIADLQLKTIEKVEELTLYLIELKKENDKLKQEIQSLKK